MYSTFACPCYTRASLSAKACASVGSAWEKQGIDRSAEASNPMAQGTFFGPDRSAGTERTSGEGDGGPADPRVRPYLWPPLFEGGSQVFEGEELSFAVLLFQSP